VPRIYKVRCDTCAFETNGRSSQVLYVTLEDGSQEACPHPGEWLWAEASTGCRWQELDKAGRLSRRRPFLCLDCGKSDYYEPRERKAGSRFGRGLRRPRPESQLWCNGCGGSSLYPFYCVEPMPRGCVTAIVALVWGGAGVGFGLYGCIDLLRGHGPGKLFAGGVFLLAAIGFGIFQHGLDKWHKSKSKSKPRSPNCPKCREGELTRERVGTS
jgi:hypothetical protein